MWVYLICRAVCGHAGRCVEGAGRYRDPRATFVLCSLPFVGLLLLNFRCIWVILGLSFGGKWRQLQNGEITEEHVIGQHLSCILRNFNVKMYNLPLISAF